MALDVITGVSPLNGLSSIYRLSEPDTRVDLLASTFNAEQTRSIAAKQAESRAVRQREREDDQRREEARQQVAEQNARDLEAFLTGLNDVFGQRNFDAQFAIDSELNRVIVRVTDKESHDLIRQVPLEGLLDLSRRAEGARGFLLNEFV
jgi:flagellar protein FlaG